MVNVLKNILPEYLTDTNRLAILVKSLFKGFDWVQAVCLLILGIVGVFFIYSAQLYNSGTLWKKQIIWLVVGGLVYIGVSLSNYKILLEKGHLIYYASLLLLLLLWTPLGETRYNSTRWIDLKFFSFQPSEAAKIGVLIMVSNVLARSEIGNVRDSFKVLIKVLLILLIPIWLIFKQPDLGSALVFPPMVFSLLYISKLSERFFISVLVFFMFVAGIVAHDIYSYHRFLSKNNLSAYENRGMYEKHSILPLKDYQRNRILAFVAPESIDPKGIGVSWNLRQSLLAAGSGGLTGKGWQKSTQAKLGYLPRSVAHNDFIFSVIAEEKGFMGSLIIISLFAVILGNGIRIAGKARDRFGMLLAVGVSVIFMVHIFVNIGMTIGLMPITGLPLPFISYGGSFIFSCCILQGLIQSVYRYRKDYS